MDFDVTSLWDILFEESLDIMFLIDPDTKKIITANNIAIELLGYTAEELKELDFSKLTNSDTGEDSEEDKEFRGSIIEGQSLHAKDGTKIQTEATWKLFPMPKGNLILTSFRDITERVNAQEQIRSQKKFYEFLLENIDVEISVLSEDLIYEYTNLKIGTGFPFSEWIQGKNKYEVVNFLGYEESVAQKRIENAKRALETGEAQEFEELIHVAGKPTRYFIRKIIKVYSQKDKMNKLICYGLDITERKQAEEKIYNLAYYDSLTGLPNRALFLDHLNQSLLLSNNTEEKIAVLYIDLDGFKLINDNLGYIKGDIILRSISKRISSMVVDYDTFARLGADEFVLLMNKVESVDKVTSTAREILNMFHEPFQVLDSDVFLSASIGISLFPDDAHSSSTLLKNSDMAMHLAKEQGKNTFRFFTNELNDRVENRLRIENDLRKALDNEEIFIAYQPQLDLKKKNIGGVEALVRWKHPTRGMIYPSEFISIAEESGLIDRLGEYVFEKSCKEIYELHKKTNYPFFLSINISGRQLQKKRLSDIVRTALEKTQFPPHWLVVELTESSLMSNVDQIIESMKYLESQGVQISIDDFGTGYSSLSYIKKFEAHHLKIDKTFIDDITTDRDDLAICNAIIQMAHSLNIFTVAEGVESKSQLELLNDLGCDFIQGYYYSKPIDIVKLEQFLLSESAFELQI